MKNISSHQTRLKIKYVRVVGCKKSRKTHSYFYIVWGKIRAVMVKKKRSLSRSAPATQDPQATRPQKHTPQKITLELQVEIYYNKNKNKYFIYTIES